MAGIENWALCFQIIITLTCFFSSSRVVNWDGNSASFEQQVYYFCRTDPHDIYENTEWFAINSYRHCDGFAASKDEIIGWPQIKADYELANFPGPVLFGEYGCRERGFPTMDGWETQRTWYQAEALYTPEYSDVFAGGFVFEYSAEKEVIDLNLQFLADRVNNGVPTSEWPYQKFAKVNYGVGYFSPVDCQHDNESSFSFRTGTPCEYMKYPEFDGLAETLAKADGQNIRSQFPGSIPECPERFQPLSFYDWPTDEEEDPDLEYCLELKRIEDSKTDAPTTSPTESVTNVPTLPPSESIITSEPTLAPSRLPTVSPVFLTESPVMPTESPFFLGTSSPDSFPMVPPTLSPTFPPSPEPSSKPTMLPTMPPTFPPSPGPSSKPTMSPTLQPSPEPSSKPTMSPTVQPSPKPSSKPTMSPTKSPTNSPTDMDSTSSPSSLTTEIQSEQCSFHPKCYAANLQGSCCPTLDGVNLGCCGSFWDTDEAKSPAKASVLQSLSFQRVSFLLVVSTALIGLL